MKKKKSIYCYFLTMLLSASLFTIPARAAGEISGTLQLNQSTVSRVANSEWVQIAASYSGNRRDIGFLGKLGSALAAELANEIVSGSYGQAEIKSDEKSISLSAIGTKVERTVLWFTGGYSCQMTTTLQFKNLKSFPIKIDYTYSGNETFSGGASGTLEIPVGKSVTVTLQGPDGGKSSGTMTITKIYAENRTRMATTFEGRSGGTYEVSYSGGNMVIQPSDSVPVAAGTASYESDTFTLTATPESGYVCYGWAGSQSGFIESKKQSNGTYTATYGAADEQTIYPLFAKEGSAMFYIAGDETNYYTFFDDAINAAGTSGTIVLKMSGTALHTPNADGSEVTAPTYQIPAGVTLLLPYANRMLTIDSTTKTDRISGTLEHANKRFSNTMTGVLNTETGKYLELEIPDGVTIQVDGRIVTGGTIASAATNYSGATAGAHSNLVLGDSAEINLGSSGVLSSCGYVLGGTVYAEAGAKIYQPFSIADFRGGSYTVATNGEIAPFTMYSMQNIQSQIIMESNAMMYGYCDLYTGTPQQHNVTAALIIGGPSTGDSLIKLSSGATLTSTYDRDRYASSYSPIGNTTIEITGGASMGVLSLDVTVGTSTTTVSTDNVVFPLPYNYSFSLLGAGATYTINYSLAIMPGATVTLGEGATLNIDCPKGSAINKKTINVIVFDGLQDYTTVAKSVKYEAERTTTPWLTYPWPEELTKAGYSECGNLIINGTLNIGTTNNSYATTCFGGAVQTKSDTGVITASGTFSPSATANVGMVSSDYGGRTTRTLPAQVYSRNSAAPTQIVKGKTYYSVSGDKKDAHVQENFTYTLYLSDGVTQSPDPVKTYPIDIAGSWYQYKCPAYAVFNPLCQQDGYVYVMETDDLAALGYCTDAGLTTPASAVGSTIDLYKAAVAVNFSKTTENGVTAKSAYLSLASAAKNYSADGAAYIQMQADDTDGAELASGTVLDLNGHKVTGVTANGTIKGVDSSSDGFKTPSGSLTVTSGAVATVAQVNGKDYVAVQEGNTYTFHRFAITPIACRFYLNDIKNHAHLEVKAAIQGDNTIFNQKLLKYLGFKIDTPEIKWYGVKEPTFTGTDADAGNNRSISYIALTYDGTTLAEYKTDHTIVAVAAFDTEKKQLIQSDGSHSISLYEVLRKYTSSTEIDAARVSAFIGKLT